jgi:hypothetical protein
MLDTAVAHQKYEDYFDEMFSHGCESVALKFEEWLRTQG